MWTDSPAGLLINPLLGGSAAGNVTVTNDRVTGTILRASAGSKSLLQAGAMVARSKGNIECVSLGECGQTSTTSVGNKTWQRVVGLRSVPLILRVQYQNPTAIAYTVDKTNVKLSTTYVSDAGGLDPTGAMTPLNVLWSAAASIVVGAGSITAPAYSAWSDPLFLPTVSRADGGTFPIAYIRSFINNGGLTAYPYQGANNYAGNPANALAGLVRKSGFQTGDFIATPTGFNDTTGLRLCMNLEFTEFARGIKIVSLGDSITSGNAVNGGIGGADRTFVDVALESINPATVSYGTILSHSNCGVASTILPDYIGRLPNILTYHTPDIVVLPVWSPNSSPTTQALLDGNNGLVLQAISRVLASGAVPILWTSPPQNSTTAAIDALRVSNNAFWRVVAAQNGFYLADFASVWDGTPIASVTQWSAGNSTDGTHPNTAGNISAAAVLVPILNAAAGLI